MTTWRTELIENMHVNDETYADLVFNQLTEAEMDVKFYSGHGGTGGKPFLAWTADRVYFCVFYDGAEWIDSVPRNPCEEAASHIGGE